MAIALAARRKVMLAAGNVTTNSIREAAILGGIVRCAINTGRFDPDFVRVYTHNIIGAMGIVNEDRRYPVNAEIAMVKSKFEDHWGGPFH